MNGLNVKEIDDLYYYHKNDLGCKINKGVYTFKVWTPLADKASLCVYEEWDKKNAIRYDMKKGQKGIWYINIEENLELKYYTYEITINNEVKEGIDPYARAVSVNGEKGAIIDLKKTNPNNWLKQHIPTLQTNTDAVIYELHVRDLSIDKDSGIRYKGKYLGLTESQTTGLGGIKTGLSHIKNLGVTHIQLLPIYDFGSIDESKTNIDGEFENSREYNWGYDPENYNAPEGSYSLNPYDPISRIKELKMAIKTIHENGIGVIMDVVYNHMYDSEKSSFNKFMPGYFFRYNEDNTLADESMCGNVLASENLMVRKFIVDSVKYWAEEYKIDGFRFDLMGLIDIDTMNEVRKELIKINPSIIVLGEGWKMSGILNKGNRAAINSNANKLKNIAFFNDSLRDALRGNAFIENDKGFLTGEKNNKLEVMKSIVGGVRYCNDMELWEGVDPTQVVNYIECHDNHTLYDKLKLTCDDEENLKYMHRLGMSIILLSQGIPFIHAGQEFLRSKNGVENSYNSNDSINKLDWNRKKNNIDSVEYVKGLIKLRKGHPAFRMNNSDDIRKYISFIECDGNCIAYIIEGNANKDEFKNILVVHNADKHIAKINSKNIWQVIVNKNIVDENGIEILTSKIIEVEGLSTLVAVIK